MLSQIDMCKLILMFYAIPALAQLPAATQTAIDEAVRKILTESGVASASIAVVKDAKVAYVKAYGDARLEPRIPAQPAMRYKIASNSKQITATAILLLAEEGKLSLDDAVGKYLPDLTRAGEVTIRELLSHTSGYQDFYPLDYVAPFMTHAISPQGIMDTWAKKPLDFDPGTKWQYSNTNYVIAGVIIEKVTGKPLMDFLRARVFVPLGMRSPVEVDRQPWSSSDPLGYGRFALGPSRPAAPEAPGWMFAAGELAMTAGDLALWDISLMTGTVLKPASLKALTTEVHLKNGAGTGYALGLGVSNLNGRRAWRHSGGAAGFISSNTTLPDDRISVTVLTNQDYPAAGRMERRIEELLTAGPQDNQGATNSAAALELVKRVFTELQQGKLDRSQFTQDGNAYFSERAVADFAASLKPLGAPSIFRQTHAEDRGGMTTRVFAIHAGEKDLELSTYIAPGGKIAQYLVYPATSAR